MADFSSNSFPYRRHSREPAWLRRQWGIQERRGSDRRPAWREEGSADVGNAKRIFTIGRARLTIFDGLACDRPGRAADVRSRAQLLHEIPVQPTSPWLRKLTSDFYDLFRHESFYSEMGIIFFLNSWIFLLFNLSEFPEFRYCFHSCFF